MAKSAARIPKRSKTANNVADGLLRRQISVLVHQTLNKALNSFYVVGDMYHEPICFGPSEINKALPDLGNKACWKELVNYLFGEARTWQVMVYHFLDHDGIIESIPVRMIIDDITLGLVADMVTPFINSSKEMIFEQEEYKGLESHYVNYGYYINWGDDINFDAMDGNNIEAFFKVTRDLSAQSDTVAIINGKNLIDNLHKAPHVNAKAEEGVELTTNMVEVTEELLKEFDNVSIG